MVASCTASSASARSPVQRAEGRQHVAPRLAHERDQGGRAAGVRRRRHVGGQPPIGMTGRTSTAPSQARRDLGRAGDGLVEVGALEEVEAGEDLLGLGVGAVGGDDVTALARRDADGGGGGGRVERGAAAQDGGGGGAERAVLGHLLGLLGRGPVEVGGVDDGGVLRHGGLPVARGRRGAGPRARDERCHAARTPPRARPRAGLDHRARSVRRGAVCLLPHGATEG